MRYRVALHRSEEGFSVSVPGLPGCWSQGATEAEAIANIKDAIREYLAVVDDQLRDTEAREIDVACSLAEDSRRQPSRRRAGARKGGLLRSFARASTSSCRTARAS
jgi:predicted RNase H-like HicB family nuclease